MRTRAVCVVADQGEGNIGERADKVGLGLGLEGNIGERADRVMYFHLSSHSLPSPIIIQTPFDHMAHG